MKVGAVDEEKEKWCPFAYEFLLDFYYICGHIGHIERNCEIQMEKGEPQLFSRSLRYIPEKKRGEGQQVGKMWSGKARGPWIGGGSNSRSSFDSRGGCWGSRGLGSDSSTWRKSTDGKNMEKGEEVTSPLKEIQTTKEVGGGARKNLSL